MCHWPAPADLLVSQRDPGNAGNGTFRWAPLEGPTGLLQHLERNTSGLVPSGLLMLAGITPGPGVTEAELAGNRLLAEACVAAAQAAGIGRVLLASSSAVYGVDDAGSGFAETTPPHPVSAYGRAKLDMEAAGLAGRDAGLEVCALRIGNVAGADALLWPLTGRAADPERPLRIHGFSDGLGPLRSYIGPGSLARVLAALAAHSGPLPEIVNVAAPEPVRMIDLARAAGWTCQLIEAPASAHQDITLDCSLLAGLCPMTSNDSLPEEMVRQWKASWV